MSPSLKSKLKNRLPDVLADKPKVNIGKSGITEAILKEIDNQLDHLELIKIRFLKNYQTEDFQDDIIKVTKKTKSSLVDKRGKTIIIYRPKRTSNE